MNKSIVDGDFCCEEKTQDNYTESVRERRLLDGRLGKATLRSEQRESAGLAKARAGRSRERRE